MHIVDSAFSLKALESVIEDVKEGIDVIYVDSIQNIIVNEEVENKYQYITSRLTALAKKMNLPIVITSQVSLENDSIVNSNTDKVIEEIKSLSAYS